jgi:intracellular sulfur oxidation DsrE/DsrF family protein
MDRTTRNTVVLVTRNGLGCVDAADQAFGLAMFDRLIHTLETAPEKPHAMCFYTRGVQLVCEGSPALLGLQLLQGLGVRMVVCQTCLEHYGLQEKVRVGEVGGMSEIVAILTAAEKVIAV